MRSGGANLAWSHILEHQYVSTHTSFMRFDKKMHVDRIVEHRRAFSDVDEVAGTFNLPRHQNLDR